MSPRLSHSQKAAYIGTARALLDDFGENTSYADHLEHVLTTYGGLIGVTRDTLANVFGRCLPLYGPDRMLNAFVGRGVLCDTELVMGKRVDFEDDINDSLWDLGLDDDHDLDRKIACKARAEDRYQRREWGMTLGIAPDHDIRESADDGDDRPPYRDAPQENLWRPPQGVIVLTNHIIEECRIAMVPLTWSICPNKVRQSMNARVERLRRMAVRLKLSDDDEFQLR